MKRNIDMKEISDGKLYGLNDMVKADCKGCQECSACCHGMGNSIVLTPLDVYRLEQKFSCSFGELMAKGIEVNRADSLILPNLAMNGKEEACQFLDAAGRCSIHDARPDICRLFPLGRFYEENGFRYFLQIHECAKPDRLKIKVKKWIQIENLAKHETYINDWHRYCRQVESEVEAVDSIEVQKEILMELLKRFYVRPYELNRDFYEQFYERMEETDEK